MPRFSVVIAVFNKEAYITKTLQSVLQQTYTDFEIVIVNDGSTDASEEKILAFTDDRINYHSQENQGAAAARNTAIKKATGDYIALLDADDWWSSVYLEEQNRLIDNYKNKSVFATSVSILENDLYHSRDYSIDIEKDKSGPVNYFKASMLSSILHSSSTVVKKDVFDKVGLYDPTIKSGQDTDLYVRIGLNYEIVFLNKQLVTYNNMVANGLFKSITTVNDKANFIAYESLEKNNQYLKKFLDLNRFSLCILAKLNNENKSFKTIYSKINLENLNKKQRLLLKMPSWGLKIMLRFKNQLAKSGIRLSAFR